MSGNSGLLRKGWVDGVYISQRSIWIQEDLNIYEKILWMCLENLQTARTRPNIKKHAGKRMLHEYCPSEKNPQQFNRKGLLKRRLGKMAMEALRLTNTLFFFPIREMANRHPAGSHRPQG